MPRLHILSHPLASHVLTHLRDITTRPATFRTLADQIALLLTIEATRSLPLRTKEIETPLERTTGEVLASPLAVIPILRSGLAMVSPFTTLFPDISVGYIGLERSAVTAKAHTYYQKLPPMEDKHAMIVDPMLATGGSAIDAIQCVKESKPLSISLLCIIGSPEGAAAVQAAHPDVNIYLGVLDRALNAKKYIVPGLGDFGDRLYGTTH
jgi:uracil phosphoribosyltransferase